ncbi:MAG: preprotein translocase subunit SecE [Erysipelotrichaceae bacterium]
MKWFSLSGIMQEVKRIRWPKKEDLFKDFSLVIIFCIFFGIWFVFSDTISAFFLKLIGIGA